MPRRLRVVILAVLALLSHTASAGAQSDILLRLRSGSPSGDRVRVDSAGGFVAMGHLGIGIIPQSSAGERMMWHPFRAAFRAGGISSNQWDDANIGFYSWAGGRDNTAGSLGAFAMGDGNTIDSGDLCGSAIALGTDNRVWHTGSNQTQCGVAIGRNNDAVDGQTAIAIGDNSTARGDFSIAIGRAANTNGRDGAIVLADGSTADSLLATADNQFAVRAAGGIRFYTNTALSSGLQLAAGGSSWVGLSDRNRKQDFVKLDGEDILARVRMVPVSSWRYVAEEDRTVRHIGPMAQDWQRAFGLSADTMGINMSDLDGVNLAAVQALERRTTALAEENRRLTEELAETRERLRRIEAALERMEQPKRP